MKYYAVIDTNVLVSAMLKWDSFPGNVMELIFSGTIIPLLNYSTTKEYREILLRPKFHWTEDIVEVILSEIDRFGIYVDAEKLNVELPDPKDRIFYEVVMEGRKSENVYLVTGNNKHFPEQPYVVTPRQMIEIIFASTEK